MTTLQHIADVITSPAVVERIGWLLVHSLWQFALIAAMAIALGQALRRHTAAARYWMLATAMLLIVLSPLATWIVLPYGEGRLARMDALTRHGSSDLVAERREPLGDIADVIRTDNQPGGSRRTATDVIPPSAQAVITATDMPVAKPWRSVAGAALGPWLATIVAVWFCGVLLFSIRPVWSWFMVRRLRRGGTSPVAATVQQALECMRARLQMTRQVEVLASSLVTSPIVVGCFHSVILLPASFIASVPVSQLEAILAHELAHVRRYDYLVNLLQTLVETLFFYHPAVWWLSHRLRIERENCCDDLVVAALGNKVEYGRALLAVEQFRGTAASTLALGAKGGSLLSRVQRLAQSGTQQSDADSLMGVVIMCVSIVALALWVGVLGYAADGDESSFGAESQGLQCRLVALSPDANEESPDLQRAVNEFARSDDMTFGVELKNVSGEPMTLAGIRYGEGYKVQGQLNTNRLAPHLFEFSFVDADGRPVPRTKRAFLDGWIVLGGASTHEIAPGESLTVRLRPARFNPPMDYDLPPGRYRAQLRYRGPDDEVREQVRKHWPDRSILRAWPHEVISNPVEFTILESSRRAKPDDLVWGKAVEGLQAAIEFRVPDDVTRNPLKAPGVPVGTSLRVIFHVRNVSDKTISFVSESGRQGDSVLVTDEQGQKVDVQDTFFTGWPIDVAWTLEPGDVAQLHVLAPAINTLDQPGRYSIRYTIRFNSRIQKDADGNIIFPRPGDYQSELDTGDTSLFLREEPRPISASGEIHGRLVDDETGKPIRGAVVACGAVVNGSTQAGGANATTDSAGVYRLVPPSPGIYDVWLKQYRGSTMTAAADDGIPVEAGKISSSELRLTRARRVTGKVIREDGTSVPHIVVSCDSAAHPQPGSTQRIRTKHDGTFSFAVPHGRTHIYTMDQDLSDSAKSADAILDVPSSGDIPPITLTLEKK